MGSGPDDAWQVGVIVEAAGVDRRTTVPQQQRTHVTLHLGLRDRLVEVYRTMYVEPDVAVRVDQPGQDPAAVKHRVGARDGLRAQRAVDNPPFDRLFVGQSATTKVEAHSLP